MTTSIRPESNLRGADGCAVEYDRQRWYPDPPTTGWLEANCRPRSIAPTRQMTSADERGRSGRERDHGCVDRALERRRQRRVETRSVIYTIFGSLHNRFLGVLALTTFGERRTTSVVGTIVSLSRDGGSRAVSRGLYRTDDASQLFTGEYIRFMPLFGSRFRNRCWDAHFPTRRTRSLLRIATCRATRAVRRRRAQRRWRHRTRACWPSPR